MAKTSFSTALANGTSAGRRQIPASPGGRSLWIHTELWVDTVEAVFPEKIRQRSTAAAPMLVVIWPKISLLLVWHGDVKCEWHTSLAKENRLTGQLLVLALKKNSYHRLRIMRPSF